MSDGLDTRRRRRLRSVHRDRYQRLLRFLAEDYAANCDIEHGLRLLRMKWWPPRWYRRGYEVDLYDFLPGTEAEQKRRSIDNGWEERHGRCPDAEGYSRAELDTAAALLLAWFATVAACRERAPHEWGVPADQPAPPQPLDRLTPLQPHAPDALALEERRAA
jgi:hypothetical protein